MGRYSKSKIILVYMGMNSPQNTGFNYGLSYIGAVLKKEGFAVEYISLLNERDRVDLYDIIKKDPPLLIGFSVTSSQLVHLKQTVSGIRSFCDSFIVCGGPHPTLRPGCLEEVTGINAIVIGEGEYPLLELAKALANDEDYSRIHSLWVNDNGNIIKNEVRPLIEDLDTLPFPDIDSLMVGQQGRYSGNMSQIRFIFSRGCPFDCSYCCNKAISDVYPNSGKYFRQRSPMNAIKEIENAEKKIGFNSIVFDDDCFTLNKKWFYEFIELYERRFKYHFRCNLRVGTVDEDMMIRLKKAGASFVGIGIEHGNEEFRMNFLRKRITNKQIEDTFSLIRKHGISHADFIMVGFPNETVALFRDTVRLCRKIEARGNISIFYPYPGTELGELSEKNGWLPCKEVYREREEATIDYPGFHKEVIQFAAEAFPFFLENTRLPLRTPLALVPSMYYLYLSLGNIFRFYINKSRIAIKSLFEH